MKKITVSCCERCPYLHLLNKGRHFIPKNKEYICGLNWHDIHDIKIIPDWCPLKDDNIL